MGLIDRFKRPQTKDLGPVLTLEINFYPEFQPQELGSVIVKPFNRPVPDDQELLLLFSLVACRELSNLGPQSHPGSELASILHDVGLSLIPFAHYASEDGVRLVDHPGRSGAVNFLYLLVGDSGEEQTFEGLMRGVDSMSTLEYYGPHAVLLVIKRLALSHQHDKMFLLFLGRTAQRIAEINANGRLTRANWEQVGRLVLLPD
ncbi:MAG: hypothetical protein ACKV2O_24300 [Acidimicrobiales bacterium]